MPLKSNQGHNENSICPFLTLSLFNEWHAASTIKKIKEVIEANAKAGKYRTTCAPFGYTKGDDLNHLPVIDPDAAPIVRNIFEMRTSGISPHHIALKNIKKCRRRTFWGQGGCYLPCRG